ncbi:MAG TPA: transglycosylase SLT domain-containing protein [Burkholderiaceae bacterium]|nr:transglycosylase SLT domain-containing protein [Burkholderiaceae bacterium]
MKGSAIVLRTSRCLLACALSASPLAALADGDPFPDFTAVTPAPRSVPAPASVIAEPASPGTAAATAVPAAATAAPSSADVKDPLNQLLDRLPATTPPDTPLAEPAVVPGPQDLWQRVRTGFRMPDLDTRLADQRTRWYAEQVEYFARMAQRSSRYLYYIVEEIERRGMPTELALLPFVESAFQPEAVSSAKAAGLWQFIPSTGRDYALEQTMWKDERRSVIDSTRAALDYLQKLYDMFGDWHLALAAYNWGEGSVSRAIDKNRRAGRSTAYTSLKMPLETQHYVPKLQAVKNIVAEPEKYGIELPPVPNSPYFVAVQKSRDIDVGTAARLAEMTPEEFRELNPQFNRPVIVGAAAPTLLLPADRADTFNANFAAWEATGQPLASWTTYRLQPADTLTSVAKRAGISEQQLREANSVPPRYRLAAGSTILIPRDETMDDISAASLDARFALVPEASNLRKVTYRVRRGDTLHSVARRYNVSERDVIVWNNLTGPGLFAGQRLELTVPVARPRTTVKASKTAPVAHRPASAQASAKPQQKATKSTGGSAHGKVAAATR